MMIIFLENLTKEEAETYALVLSSSGIRSLLRNEGSQWLLLVNQSDLDRARSEVQGYTEENVRPPDGAGSVGVEYRKTYCGVWIAVILLLAHIAIVMLPGKEVVVLDYGSATSRIQRGELFRSVTSLMIHKDVLHLAGSMLSISIFGTAVCNITGWGVGCLLLLLCGAAGNITNGVLRSSEHITIGASTAVFGAIGIGVGLQFLEKFRSKGGLRKAFLPLGGGLALLAMLGTGGDHVDLMGHLLGFVWGGATGFFYRVIVKEPSHSVAQLASGVIATGIIVLAWLKVLTV